MLWRQMRGELDTHYLDNRSPDFPLSQWHVSPAAIIRNPLNLLKWASTLNITYTFSPNFLLASILRDLPTASYEESLDLCNLQALISGGEAVPFKTAVAFADVLETFGARRDVLRAGFGMSETGAGCIYDTRPIPKTDTLDAPKYISLGTCCQGVDMRIVDSDNGKLCLSGETGQLQLSGPTVFTGYYGNDRATSESFTDDGWFITGDFAQLDEDGNLYLVGRGKDVININGVKYPTQDVEHYVEDAKIEGVMASYVYVCPMRLEDADTETYGVFYQHQFVVEASLDSAQKHTISVTNRSIKNACTVFCSQPPHVVLPLPRSSFVRTALGKISHSQLSKAYLAGNFTDLQAGLEAEDKEALDGAALPVDKFVSRVEKLVAESIAAIFSLDISSLRRSQSVFDIGASSMHLLRLKQVLQERLSLTSLPTIEMLKRPQIGELCDYLSEVVAAEEQGVQQKGLKYDPIVCMNNSGSKPPLFLIHPGVGEVLVFVGLARHLADDRPVYALRARGFDYGDPTFDTFEEMVECYVSSILRVYPDGPYNIAGYSYGGAVAFEICKSLEERRKTVSFLGILNLPPHIKFRMNELSWAEVLLNLGMFLSLIPSSALNSMRQELTNTFPEVTANDSKPLDPLGPINWLFQRSDKRRFLELDLEIGAFTRWVNVAYEINRTGRTFEPQGCVKNALTSIFCAIPLPSMGTREEFKQNRLSVWREFSGQRFEMVDVDGEHYTMMSEDHVVSFAAHMRGALHRAESTLPISTSSVTSTHSLIEANFDATFTVTFSDKLEFAFENDGFGVSLFFYWSLTTRSDRLTNGIGE
jgi:thioesterase domain-containing protein